MAAKSKTYRMDPITNHRIEELAEYWNCTETEVIKRAIDLLTLEKYNFVLISSDPKLSTNRTGLMGIVAEQRLIDYEKSRS